METGNFYYFDFGLSGSRARLSNNEVSLINRKGKNTTMSFNQEVSKLIFDGGYKYMKFRVDYATGDSHFIFMRNPDSDSYMNVPKLTNNMKNVCISSKRLVSHIVDTYRLDDNCEKFVMSISENLSNCDKYLTYKILKIKRQ